MEAIAEAAEIAQEEIDKENASDPSVKKSFEDCRAFH